MNRFRAGCRAKPHPICDLTRLIVLRRQVSSNVSFIDPTKFGNDVVVIQLLHTLNAKPRLKME